MNNNETYLYNTKPNKNTDFVIWMGFPGCYAFSMSSLGYLWMFKSLDEHEDIKEEFSAFQVGLRKRIGRHDREEHRAERAEDRDDDADHKGGAEFRRCQNIPDCAGLEIDRPEQDLAGDDIALAAERLRDEIQNRQQHD